VRRESGGSKPCCKQGKLGEMLPGHRSDRMVKTLRDKSMVEKREAGEHASPVVLQGSCKACRAIWSRLDCLNLRLQGWNVTSIATACTGGAGGIGR
jgi:hypothetical protein